jgi:hypothetical protein
MAELEPWRVLRKGDPRDLVLAVDFYAPGRAEASFDDFAPLLGGDFEIWEATQPALGAEAAMDSEDYLKRWLTAIPAESRIRGVLGFCVGGVWSSTLGARIGERRGTLPPIVMFDPEPVTSLVLYWQYHKLLDKLGSILTPDELAKAKIDGISIPETSDDLGVVGDGLAKLYREIGDVGLARLGLDQVRREEMTALFDSYMSYLVASSELEPAADLSTSVVVSSDAPAEGTYLGGRELVFDIDRHELLRAPEVAARVSELLG